MIYSAKLYRYEEQPKPNLAFKVQTIEQILGLLSDAGAGGHECHVGIISKEQYSCGRKLNGQEVSQPQAPFRSRPSVVGVRISAPWIQTMHGNDTESGRSVIRYGFCRDSLPRTVTRINAESIMHTRDRPVRGRPAP